MDLPQVQMIGLIPPQRVFEHLHRKLAASPMGADLCHQEHLVAAPVPKRPSQDGLGLDVVILPSVIEESNACVYRLVNELHRLIQGRYVAKMMNAHSDCENVHIRASEFAINHVSSLACRRCNSFP